MVMFIGCLLYWKAQRPTINRRRARADGASAGIALPGDTMSTHDDEKSRFRKAMQDVRQLTGQPRAELDAAKPRATARFTSRDNAEVMRQSLGGSPLPGEIQTGEEMLYARPGLPAKVMRKLRRGQYAIENECDLHGLNAEQAKHLLVEFIDESLATGSRCVRVVHGKGLGSGPAGPVIKPLVGSYLRHRAEVLAYVTTLPAHGGSGAVYVLLK